MVLNKSFFDRSTARVAEELLGKFLVRGWRGKEIAGMITEVEVYDGFQDKASHASRGKTERNKIMFGPAGHWYVYFTYGMHWMLNIVTRKKEYPAAILIRGIVLNFPFDFSDTGHSSIIMPNNNLKFSRYRSFAQRAHSLALLSHSFRFTQNRARSFAEPRSKIFRSFSLNGPAKLTKYFHIDKKLNGGVANKKSGLWIEDKGVKIKSRIIMKDARIGISSAGPVWGKKKLRFYIK